MSPGEPRPTAAIVRAERPWLAWEAECVRLLRECGTDVVVVLVPAAAASEIGGLSRLASKAARGEHSAIREVAEPTDLNTQAVSAATGGFDVAVALGAEPEVRRAASRLAGRGEAWSLDLEVCPGGAPAAVLGAMQTGVAVVEARLVRLGSAGQPERVLHLGATKVTSKSFTRTLDAALWAAAGLPARVFREWVAANGALSHQDAEVPATPRSPRTSPAAMAGFALRCAVARVQDALVWLTRHEQWGVGIVRQPIHSYLSGDKHEVEWLPACERDRFIADCFGVLHSGTMTLLVEEYPQRTARGILSAFSWRESAPPPARPTPVLELPVHLSYPYLVEDGGQLYCIPETSEASEVALYRVDELPGRWTRIGTLITGFPALDSTVFRHDGRWWLLAARQTPTQSLELHGWHSRALAGPWTPHALNPLKCDIRSSRPAGTPFVHEGVCYRPAQDCSREYGGAVSICRIDRLTPNQFAETVVKSVSPDPRGPYPRGLHTISAVLGAADRLTVIDGKRRVFVPRLFVREVGSGLRRVAGKR